MSFPTKRHGLTIRGAFSFVRDIMMSGIQVADHQVMATYPHSRRRSYFKPNRVLLLNDVDNSPDWLFHLEI